MKLEVMYSTGTRRWDYRIRAKLEVKNRTRGREYRIGTK